ncbi:MAG: hypothetical protein ACM3UU_08510 [Ignavibacteriales bacterium]
MDGINSVDLINYVLIGIITILSVIVFILFVTFVVKKKDPNKTLIELNDKLKTYDKNQETFDQNALLRNTNVKKSMKKKELEGEKDKNPNLQPGVDLLDIDNINNDMLVGIKNQICAMVIECKGINFELMSKEEKMTVEKTFSNFVNNLEIPLQLYIQTRTIHYKDTTSMYDTMQTKYETELRTLMEKLNEIETSSKPNTSELAPILARIRKIQRIYEYAKQLRFQVEKIKKTNAIMQNNYYIVLNYFSINPDEKVNLKLQNNLDIIRNDLKDKCTSIIESLKRCGVESYILSSPQLAELFCSAFLCEDEHMFRLRDLMESGFLRVSSSIKDTHSN